MSGGGEGDGIRPRVFAVWVEDRPGVLNRITSLFRRRGFNIESLSVGRAKAPGVSRMTIVVRTDATGAKRMAVQLYRLVNVLRADDITGAAAIRKELAMFKVSANAKERTEVIQLATATGARIVDVAPGSVVVEAAAAPEKIEGLAEVLRPYGILEQVRTGLVGMARGAESVMSDPAARRVPQPSAGGAEDDPASGSPPASSDGSV